MKKLLTHLFILLILADASQCQKKKRIERDSLNFNTPVSLTEKKFLSLNNLMDKISFERNEIHNVFFDNKEQIYINNKNIGTVDSINSEAEGIFKNLTVSEKSEFIILLKFFKSNRINSVFLDKSCKCYLYNYHQLDNPTFSTDRLIYLYEEGKEYSTILVDRKILDRKGNLVLIGAR